MTRSPYVLTALLTMFVALNNGRAVEPRANGSQRRCSDGQMNAEE